MKRALYLVLTATAVVCANDLRGADLGVWNVEADGYFADAENWTEWPANSFHLTEKAVNRTITITNQHSFSGYAFIGTGAAAAVKFIDGATTNFVTLAANDGCGFSNLNGGLRIADSGNQTGALRIDGGVYNVSQIWLGASGSTGILEVCSGRVYASEDLQVDRNKGSGHGHVIVGSDSGDKTATLEVSTSKWLALTRGNNSTGILELKRGGTVKSIFIQTENPTGTQIVFDGGTLIRTGGSAGYVFGDHDQGYNVWPTVRVTENGGTIDINDKDAQFGSAIEGVGRLVKTGSAKLTLLNAFTTDCTLAISNGTVLAQVGTTFGSLEIADGAKLIIDTTSIDGEGEHTVRFVSEEGTLTLPEGKTIQECIQVGSDMVEPGDTYNVTFAEDGKSATVEIDYAYTAAIDDANYHTLQDALAAANAGQTIRFLTDMTNGSVSVNKNVTIDFDGHVFTRRADCTDCFGVTAETVTFRNGKIETHNGHAAISLDGDGVRHVTAEGMTIEAGMCFHSAQNARGTIVATNSTLKADEKGGVFAGSSVNVLLTCEDCDVTLKSGAGFRHPSYGSAQIKLRGGRYSVDPTDSLDFGYIAVRYNDDPDGLIYHAEVLLVTGGAYDFDPRNYLEEGYVTRFVASDTETPFRVVPETDCPYEACGFNFVDEADFLDNASARIGEKYYLFLSDAVDDAESGDAIELLKDNNFVLKQIDINIPLTIEGNGHTVKVPVPFVDESGYVNRGCTFSPKTVMRVNNGGDAVIRNLTVMGGGDPDSSNSTAEDTGVVVATGGFLEMHGVTITRSNGGLFTQPDSHIYLDRCQIVRNCRYCGGGMYNRGSLVMVNSSLSENRSSSGGGGGGAAENQGFMYVNNCVICNNASTQVGGAINNYSGEFPVALYMINSTISGNFTSQANAMGGGIGLRASGNKEYDGTKGAFYAVNNIIFGNYYYDTGSKSVETSDIRIYSGNVQNPVNFLEYNLYGDFGDGGNAHSTVMANNIQVGSADAVFLDYYASVRVYGGDSRTEIPVNGARLYSDPSQPLARYAPIDPEGLAVPGDEGVTTYFDATGWRTGDVRMSYKTKDGEMTSFGDLTPATTDDLVTTFYETGIVPGTITRAIGIVGASGWAENDVARWTLKLIEQPKNGMVGNISLYGDTYKDGTEVTVVATPDFACTFLGWYDADDVLVSSDAAYTFAMTADLELKAKFSEPSSVVELNVTCDQAGGNPDKFPITVTTTWLNDNGIVSGAITDANRAEIEAALDSTNAVSGLTLWQTYVLGLDADDPNGRIWIRGEQTADSGTLRLRMQKFAPVIDSGFAVRYRLDTMLASATDYTRGGLANEGVFDVPLSTDPSGRYLIDLVFIPDGFAASEEYVTTVNTAGVLKVETTKNVEILASPWAGFSPTDNPAVKATDYVKAACLSVGDVLYVYDQEASNYLAWTVQEGGTWKPVRTYLLTDGVATPTDADAARTNAIPRGAGAWLERRDAAAPVYLYGQVDGSPVTTMLAPGWNLVGAPTGEAFDAGALPEPKSADDHVIVPAGGAPLNCTYASGAWSYVTNVTVSVRGRTVVAPTRASDGLVLPAGVGFWYVAAQGGTLEWGSTDGE